MRERPRRRAGAEHDRGSHHIVVLLHDLCRDVIVSGPRLLGPFNLHSDQVSFVAFAMFLFDCPADTPECGLEES